MQIEIDEVSTAEFGLYVIAYCIQFTFFSCRKTSSCGSSNLIDTCSSEKAYEMIAELQLTEEQLRENGYPRPGDKPGMANMFKPQTGVAHNKNDRYCSRCGIMFNLEHFDDFCVDKCNYHAKRPGFRRGEQNIPIFFFF